MPNQEKNKLNEFQVITSAIQNPNCILTHLDFNYYGTKSLPASKYSETSYHCSLTRFGDQAAAIIAEGFASNRSILSLSFSHHSFTDHGMSLILNAIRKKGNLSTLTFYEHYINDQNLALIASIITDPYCALTSFRYSYVDQESQNIHCIIEAITHPNCKITTLDLIQTHLSSASISILAETLKNPQCTLSTLDVRESSQSGIQLTEALQCNLTLMSLQIKWGLQEPEIIELLQNNVHIQYFKILHDHFDNLSRNLMLEYTCENLNPTMLHARMNQSFNHTKHLPLLPMITQVEELTSESKEHLEDEHPTELTPVALKTIISEKLGMRANATHENTLNKLFAELGFRNPQPHEATSSYELTVNKIKSKIFTLMDNTLNEISDSVGNELLGRFISIVNQDTFWQQLDLKSQPHEQAASAEEQLNILRLRERIKHYVTTIIQGLNQEIEPVRIHTKRLTPN
jgi:hypothetical protein